jgi:hypothetical protein
VFFMTGNENAKVPRANHRKQFREAGCVMSRHGFAT